MKASVRFAGLGGQGIIFSGIVLARAAALYECYEGRSLHAIQTQSYGPAARGAFSKCDVVISDEERFYPFVDKPNFLVIMSQPAFEMYAPIVSPETVIILDEDMVEGRPNLPYYEIAAMHRAGELGLKDSTNMIMLGALVKISGLVSRESAEKAFMDISPVRAVEKNKRAFEEGFALASSKVKVVGNL